MYTDEGLKARAVERFNVFGPVSKTLSSSETRRQGHSDSIDSASNAESRVPDYAIECLADEVHVDSGTPIFDEGTQGRFERFWLFLGQDSIGTKSTKFIRRLRWRTYLSTRSSQPGNTRRFAPACGSVRSLFSLGQMRVPGGRCEGIITEIHGSPMRSIARRRGKSCQCFSSIVKCRVPASPRPTSAERLTTTSSRIPLVSLHGTWPFA